MSGFTFYVHDLLTINAGSKYIRDISTLVIAGNCVLIEHKDLLSPALKDEKYAILTTCPEAFHINMVETKLAAILKLCRISKLIIITVDGSPHCIQLHYLPYNLRKYHGFHELSASHFVIHSGKIFQIDPEIVALSKKLSKLQRILRKS